MNVSDYPPLYVAADTASGWGQRWYRRIIAVNLALVLLASSLGYVAGLIGDPGRIAAGIAATIALSFGVFARPLHRLLRDDKSWFEGRAVAETVKSLTWRYMMRTPPFDDEARADAAFVEALGEVR